MPLQRRLSESCVGRALPARQRTPSRTRMLAGRLGQAAISALAFAVLGWQGEAGEAGYQPAPQGTVRLWDLGKAYGKGLSMGFVGWSDRAQWTQVPHGTTPETVERDVAIEGTSFFFNITWRPDSYLSGPVLYRKPEPTDPDGARHNLLYRGWCARGGIWEGGGNLTSIRVIKNTPEEVIVRSRGRKGARDPASTGVEADYCAKAGKPWLEILPVSQCSHIGMHGESRFAIFPEAEADGSDHVCDSLPLRDERDSARSRAGKMLLDPVVDDDNLWCLMVSPVNESEIAPEDKQMVQWYYPKGRFMLSVQADGYHAGWSHVGEGPCKQVVSAPYACFLGKKIVIGHLRTGFWHYQKAEAEVRKGEEFRIAWKYAYERSVKGSPFKAGEAWWPQYPGKWRLITRIDGKYRTEVLIIGKDGVGKKEQSFKPAASGKLDYVLLYLYDRIADTPETVYTPVDIYREAILGERREAILRTSRAER